MLPEILTEKNPDLQFETGLDTLTPSTIGLTFYANINNTSENDYDIEVKPDECCLEDGNRLDCDYLRILDELRTAVSNGSTKNLKLVAPLLDVYERKGHCVVYIDSKSNASKVRRNTLTLRFDTKSSSGKINLPRNFKVCKSKDEDPLNNCEPVNCDTYYNSEKSYYNKKYKRCARTPTCVSKDDTDTPNVIYDPITNKCLEEALIKEDLRYVKSLSKITEKMQKRRKSKGILIITKNRSNISKFLDDFDFIDEPVKSTTRKYSKSLLTQLPKTQTKMLLHTSAILSTIQTTEQPISRSDCTKKIFRKYLDANKWTFIVLGIVVTVQCFLICTMFYCLSKTCNCFKDKKVVRKFFYHGHDASVTTPLIGTSNIDTETDYQYVTDSSKVDQKIKCYKACHKEINNEMKVSMSDDILSKCLNRRDWRKLSRSEAVTKEGEIVQKILEEIKDKPNSKIEDAKKISETRVIFEDEISKVVKPKVSTIKCIKIVEKEKEKEKEDKKENEKDTEAEKHNIDIEETASEKEIKCHSYSCDSNVTGFQPNKKAGCFKSEPSKRGTLSLSTEKEAQASFPNDSIDDFLSERGVIHLAGENLSKYTFHTDSKEIKLSTTSSLSSKTSKNFLKNVLSLLRKKSRQGPSSDPGQKKEMNLELIHMSKASVYSSSNDSDCAKIFKRKDSRTSF
ncbi:hypothetical protein KGM_200037 [Danaus plexippus plexippus]|uniref:Uncharacterized protein n=1 Tax=Danaus plexippus plexippus TaxID=278856 RepID=A0A212F042_DANPL|nr:hypothetical protein KGM_200037 [Danaus plexippus plexippus]